jgi:hypothetical protein
VERLGNIPDRNTTLRWIEAFRATASVMKRKLPGLPDYFLSDYIKSKLYIKKPRNIQELTDSIRLEIANLENFKERLQECIQKEGHHLTDVIFRT